MTIALFCLNLVARGTPVLLVGILKLVTRGRWRRHVILYLAELAERWVDGNDAIVDRMLTTKVEVQGLDRLDLMRDGHYLIVSNHVSWIDIIVLFRVFHLRTAFLRFFMKHQLIWFPIVGQGCAALEFPFMHRYSADYLARHPEKRGKDLETTRRLCQRYRTIPVAILNFLEGTRFTREKHADQDSPYRHLLRTRIGGLSFVFASLGDQLDAVIDVTIRYPDDDVTLWDYVTDSIARIAVHVRKIEVPAEFFSQAVTEPGPVRDRFKQWVDALWTEKDAILDQPPAAAQ